MSTQTPLDLADAPPPRPLRPLQLSSAAALVLVLAVAFTSWHHPNGGRVAWMSAAAVEPAAC